MESARNPDDRNLATARWLSQQTGIPAKWFEEEAAAGRLPGVRVTPNHFIFHVPSIVRALEDRAASGENMRTAEGGDDGEA